MADKVTAVARFVPISPRKVRLVVDSVRGLKADDALAVLSYLPKAAAKPVYKVIRSAIGNAEDIGLNRADLVISEIHADDGPRRMWRRFGARGRFKPIIKRSAHITVVLTEQVEQ